MNHIQFLKERASNPQFSKYADRDWDQAVPVDSQRIFNKLISDEKARTIVLTLDDGGEVTSEIEFSDDADWEYFTSLVYYTDGTLLFDTTICEELMKKIIFMQTYNINYDPPKAGDIIKYTVGNSILLLDEYGDWPGASKKWMRTRTTAILPLKYEKVKG